MELVRVRSHYLKKQLLLHQVSAWLLHLVVQTHFHYALGPVQGQTLLRSQLLSRAQQQALCFLPLMNPQIVTWQLYQEVLQQLPGSVWGLYDSGHPPQLWAGCRLLLMMWGRC
jgi:hypothetical protein